MQEEIEMSETDDVFEGEKRKSAAKDLARFEKLIQERDIKNLQAALKKGAELIPRIAQQEVDVIQQASRAYFELMTHADRFCGEIQELEALCRGRKKGS
jgi:hypothetical protein